MEGHTLLRAEALMTSPPQPHPTRPSDRYPSPAFESWALNLKEELKSAGVYPTGPCSAWPQERNEEITNLIQGGGQKAARVRAGAKKMAGGLLRTAGQAVRHGKVSKEVREQRMDTCKACPAFLADSRRCADCGCFMEAKTWVGGNPNTLCPRKKWER